MSCLMHSCREMCEFLGIEKGLEIIRYFRSRLSSLAIPTFAIDLPEGGGKVHLQPDYTSDGGYTDIHEQKSIKYE